MKPPGPPPGKKKTPIDWREIARRMEVLRAAIEHAWAPAPEDARRILKTRAQALAREPKPAEAADAYIEVVEFTLAHERYAIESHCVREVYPLDNLTPLPCTPTFVLGIVNVHGEILSVIDIKKFFDLPENGLTDLNKVIVLQSGDMAFGILADAIIGARRISITNVQPSLPTLTDIRADYLRGVTPECSIILDAEKLLADEKIIIREQVGG